MITRLALQNYGPITAIEWDRLGPINLVIGANGTGKTTILKALYSAVRTVEEYLRGDDRTPVDELLAAKLKGVFQPDKLGDLVTKGTKEPLVCLLELTGQQADANGYLKYRFGAHTTRSLPDVEWGYALASRDINSIFLPAKEVLSLHKIILKSRLLDKLNGFDDTCLDLAVALNTSPRPGDQGSVVASARKKLGAIIGGKVAYDDESKLWYFQQGRFKYLIGLTAEGIKKIGILDVLLGNRYLTPGSTVCIDEPEAALHPKAISQLFDVIADLALGKGGEGIQFFLASHSYFVINKLYLIAHQKNISIPVLYEEDGQWQRADLRHGMPTNSIIEESVQLYREEVELLL
ncbi:MAG: AAA family ATPase [Magnetococcus sp. DMHC-8]